MNELDRASYRSRYVERLGVHGHDPKTLGWTAGKQPERFAALTSFVRVEAMSSVLDVGCGFGELFPFLRERGFTGRYVGIDLVPELIEIGRKAYPEADLRTGDISDLPHASFDLVVASGIFNAALAHEDQWTHITRTLRQMFELSAVATAADFLTSYVDFQREDLWYTSPEKVFALAKSFTRRVAISHHYMPFEFALCLFKDDRVTPQTRFHPLPGE